MCFFVVCVGQDRSGAGRAGRRLLWRDYCHGRLRDGSERSSADSLTHGLGKNRFGILEVVEGEAVILLRGL